VKEERIVRYTLENLPEDTETDWERVKAMTEEEIEEGARSDPDNPPLDDEFFRTARRITPPVKKDIHLYVDEDVLEWFKGQGKGYQTRMNAVLRAYMEASLARGKTR
jgi:uncharacterized protein (DUF4415 family)